MTPRGPIRRVFLDAGGVVVRLPYARERVWAYAQARGADVTYADVARAVDRAIRRDAARTPHRDLVRSRADEDRRTLALYGEVAEALGLGADVAADLRDCAAYASAASAYPDVAPLLAGLERRGIPVGVISNAPPSLVACLVRLDLALRFHPIVVSCEVGAVKPDAAIYRAALDRSGADAATCLFVDDLPANVAAAVALGMRGALLQRSPDDAPPDEGMTVLTGLEALLRWVDAPDGEAPDLSLPMGLRPGVL